MAYQLREFLAGQVIAVYRAEAPTSYRAAEQATGRSVTLHRSGDYFLEVTNESSGRVFEFQFADLLY